MKFTLKKIISISLLLMCGLAMQPCNARDEKEVLPPETIEKTMTEGVTSAIKAQCCDDSLPQKIKALIGKKLPPKVSGMTQAEIPEFVRVNSATLVDSGEPNAISLTYAEGQFLGDAVFFIKRVFPDMAIEILDARVLPTDLLDWRLKNGVAERNSGKYRLSERCRINDKDERIILGLVRPERGKSDCSHFSRRINQAWRLDVKSGSLTSVATKGLQCEYITMNECY